MTGASTAEAKTEVWSIDPPQALSFAGSEWEGAVVFAHGSGDTHQVSHVAAVVLECLVAGPAEVPPLLTDSLRELQRIGLVRHRNA